MLTDILRVKYSNAEFLKDLWHFLSLKKIRFIFLSFVLVLVNFLGLVPPIILAKIIDVFTLESDPLSKFFVLLTFLLSILVFNTFARLGAKHFMSLYLYKMQKYAKTESFQKILQQNLMWHDKENTGAKIEKINSGEKAIGDFINLYNNKLIGGLINFVGIIAIFAIFNLKYAIIAFIFSLIYLTIEARMNKIVRKRIIAQRLIKEASNGKTYEFSSNIATVKALGIEKKSNDEILDIEELLRLARNKKRKTSTKKWISVQLVATFFYILFIFLIGLDVVAGVMTIGAIIIYVDYIKRLQNILNMISVESTKLLEIKYKIYRMMEIYKSLPEFEEKGAKKLKDWKRFGVKNLNFRYKNKLVLKDLDLEIKRGEKIGLVGFSGSGKSTLFKLLLKLYVPKKGKVYFDGVSTKNITRDSILKNISIVQQDTELFNLSIKKNITLSRTDKFNRERYEKALEVSQTKNFINGIKRKDQTLVGEKGVRLSGGEKQRLGIARALYKDSKIIIFDEATSNLDYDLENKLQKGLDGLEDKTLIFAAHRLSTLKTMDRIFVLDEGKVVEVGSYDELVAKKGRFYELLKSKG
jgi:ATP-binding cassette, subfamily B, bacterial